MNKLIFVLLTFFQVTLHAGNIQTSANPRQAESNAGIMTGSQYNLEGKRGRDGQYKSAYSTKSVDNKNQPQSPTETYDADRSPYPVIPVIIIEGE